MTPARSGTVHVVRHAKAESRKRFTEDDRLRPLNEDGLRQAELIADHLEGVVDAVVSSPAVRCAQTVGPLALRRDLELEVVDELGEGSDPLVALDRLLELAKGGRQVVACTHGDVVYGLLETLTDAGVPLDAPITCPKAATWVLTAANGKITAATYTPPPSPHQHDQ